MPQVEARIRIAVSPAVAFAVSQTTGETRLRWDPFIRRQHFLDGATRADRGVRTFTRSRHGLSMISRYVSYAPPTPSRDVGNVGMTMDRGPWFFETFGGGWRFVADGEGGTEATWKYTFSCRPAWLRPLLHPVGSWLLGRDIRRRIAGFARGCTDPEVLAAVRGAEADSD
ncbi:SRPBCC family protein [Microlunatus speluncae]|uniref:SRPBCC family protein n=1 Tax=Microlunatus speluncae TaxID=2594267 RepID=UPI0012665EE8|nr:SRPBCC family protein [Microlunatus speluncae]